MSQVEIFMMMYSLLLGLAMTGLLSGIGELLRGRKPPRWGVLVPLASVVLFVTLLGAFVDSYSYATRGNIEMSLRSLGMPALAGVLFFLAATLAIPREQDDWTDFDAYFLARKHLIFGCITAASAALIFGVEVPMAVAAGRPIWSNTFYWIGNGLLLALQATPIFAQRRSILIGALIANLVLLGVVYLSPMPVSTTLNLLWTKATGG